MQFASTLDLLEEYTLHVQRTGMPLSPVATSTHRLFHDFDDILPSDVVVVGDERLVDLLSSYWPTSPKLTSVKFTGYAASDFSDDEEPVATCKVNLDFVRRLGGLETLDISGGYWTWQDVFVLLFQTVARLKELTLKENQLLRLLNLFDHEYGA